MQVGLDPGPLGEGAGGAGQRAGHPAGRVSFAVELGQHLVLDVLPVPDHVLLPGHLGHHVEGVRGEVDLGYLPLLLLLDLRLGLDQPPPRPARPTPRHTAPAPPPAP